MKKIISLALSLSMLACMATNAFAAAHTIGGENGVDSLGANGSDSSDYLVKITVSAGDVKHKYAVDVEYTQLDLSITGDTLTWDVNNLEYVSSGATGLEDKTGNTITIINYSDLPVAITPTLKDEDGNDGIKISYNSVSEIKQADQIEAADIGQEKSKTIIYDITLEDGWEWSQVANYYASLFKNQSLTEKTAASVSINIAAVPQNNP